MDYVKEQDNQTEVKPPVVATTQDVDLTNTDKFKKMTYEILDIGLHYGTQGMEHIQSLPLYQKVDAMVDFSDKFNIVQNHG